MSDSHTTTLSGRKRPLSQEKRIRYEEEERQLKAARGLLQERLQTVQEELQAAAGQQGQLRDQIKTIQKQIQTQQHTHARQRAQHVELTKSLSKTREAFLKIVMEARASGTLSQAQGLALIADETVKEILTLDDLYPAHSVRYRYEGILNTCLDLHVFFPPRSQDVSIDAASNMAESPSSSGDVSVVPPELDPLPDPMLPLLCISNDNDDSNEEDNERVVTCGRTLSAWWVADTGRIILPLDVVPLSIDSLLKAMGIRRLSETKLLLEQASSETDSITHNVARYVDGFLLAWHAGVVTGSLDLDYLLGALRDLSFALSQVERVEKQLGAAVSLTADATVAYARSSFEMLLALVKATMTVEDSTAEETFWTENDVNESSLEDIVESWEQQKKYLSGLTSLKVRRIETLRRVVPVGRAILQVLSNASCAIRTGDTSNNWKNLYDRIDQSLHSLLRFSFEDSFVQLLLTPLFAANVALGCTLKLYHKAYSRILALFCHQSDDTASEGVNLFIVSGMLWSQLLQLRICLPPVGVDSEQLSLYKTALDSTVAELGITLGHVKPVVGRVK